MNKHVKISLIVLVAVVLLLAVAIPALAGKPPVCSILWKGYHEKADSSWTFSITGSSEYDLDENLLTLTRTCTGIIPLGGETVYPWVTAYDRAGMKDYLCIRHGGDACEINVDDFIIGPDETGGEDANIEYKGDKLSTLNWFLSVDQDGNYVFESVFSLSDE